MSTLKKTIAAASIAAVAAGCQQAQVGHKNYLVDVNGKAITQDKCAMIMSKTSKGLHVQFTNKSNSRVSYAGAQSLDFKSKVSKNVQLRSSTQELEFRGAKIKLNDDFYNHALSKADSRGVLEVTAVIYDCDPNESKDPGSKSNQESRNNNNNNNISDGDGALGDDNNTSDPGDDEQIGSDATRYIEELKRNQGIPEKQTASNDQNMSLTYTL